MPELFGEVIDVAIPLAEEVEDSDPLLAGERLADAGELLIQAVGDMLEVHRFSSRIGSRALPVTWAGVIGTNDLIIK
ncbi:hypothetical protein GMSM_43180 [Geomonas sp. Red276]